MTWSWWWTQRADSDFALDPSLPGSEATAGGFQVPFETIAREFAWTLASTTTGAGLDVLACAWAFEVFLDMYRREQEEGEGWDGDALTTMGYFTTEQ